MMARCARPRPTHIGGPGQPGFDPNLDPSHFSFDYRLQLNDPQHDAFGVVVTVALYNNQTNAPLQWIATHTGAQLFPKLDQRERECLAEEHSCCHQEPEADAGDLCSLADVLDLRPEMSALPRDITSSLASPARCFSDSARSSTPSTKPWAISVIRSTRSRPTFESFWFFISVLLRCG
jgi:hypothetical protein